MTRPPMNYREREAQKALRSAQLRSQMPASTDPARLEREADKAAPSIWRRLVAWLRQWRG